MLAYVRDNELHVSNLLYNVSKQLTMGANDSTIVSIMFHTMFNLVSLLLLFVLLAPLSTTCVCLVNCIYVKLIIIDFPILFVYIFFRKSS